MSALRCILLFVGCLWAVSSTAGKERPNVLFILIDDLGWNDVGFNGSTFHETPNLDQLAKEWMRFDRYYTASPMCSPTRVTLMTGKNPVRHGVTQWLPGRQVKNQKLLCAPPVQAIRDEEITLAEAFKDAGYDTAFFGKWHMGPLKKTGGPKNHGFDHEVAVIETNRCSMFYPFRGVNYFPDAKEGDHFTEKLTDSAIEFLSRKRDKPFLAYLSHFAMHAPIASKKELREKFAKKAAKLPPLKADEAGVKDRYSHRAYKKRQDDPEYAGQLATLDENIGRVVAHLKKSGQYENTIIVLSGDNGGRTAVGFHGHPTSVQPLRAGKTFLFEGGLRTPLLIHWPGHTQPGRHSQFPVTSADLYPTLLHMAGLPQRPEQHQDGEDFSALFQESAIKKSSTLYWHFPHYQGEGAYPASAILSGKHKLIINYHFDDILLFDVFADPNEAKNLADEGSVFTKHLKARLKDYLFITGARMPQRNPNYRAPKEKKE